jgi:hypothetical protein
VARAGVGETVLLKRERFCRFGRYNQTGSLPGDFMGYPARGHGDGPANSLSFYARRIQVFGKVVRVLRVQGKVKWTVGPVEQRSH